MTQLFLLFLMTCFTLSCTTKDKPQKSTIPTLSFTVNRQLLGDSVYLADEGLKIIAPRHWKPMSAVQMNEISEKMHALEAKNGDSTNLIRVGVESVFVLQNGGASLVISRIRFPKQDSTEDLQRLHYSQQTKERIDSTSLGTADFMCNNIRLTQYMIRTSQSVSFRLFFKARSSMMQCDYIIPTSIFQQEIRAVESSIGSILFTQ